MNSDTSTQVALRTMLSVAKCLRFDVTEEQILDFRLDLRGQVNEPTPDNEVSSDSDNDPDV